MKLWLLEPGENKEAWEPWYDKALGFVVIAASEEDARDMANAEGGDETGEIMNRVYRRGGDPWLDPEQSTCVELKASGEARVVLRDFASA